MTVHNNYYRVEDRDEAFVLLMIAISQGRTFSSLDKLNTIDLDDVKCIAFSNQLPKLDSYNVMNNYAGNTIKLYKENIGTVSPARFITRHYKHLLYQSLFKEKIPNLPKYNPTTEYKFDKKRVPLYDKRMYLSDINKAYKLVIKNYINK